MLFVAVLAAIGIGYAVSEGTEGHLKPAPDAEDYKSVGDTKAGGCGCQECSSGFPV